MAEMVRYYMHFTVSSLASEFPHARYMGQRAFEQVKDAEKVALRRKPTKGAGVDPN